MIEEINNKIYHLQNQPSGGNTTYNLDKIRDLEIRLRNLNNDLLIQEKEERIVYILEFELDKIINKFDNKYKDDNQFKERINLLIELNGIKSYQDFKTQYIDDFIEKELFKAKVSSINHLYLYFNKIENENSININERYNLKCKDYDDISPILCKVQIDNHIYRLVEGEYNNQKDLNCLILNKSDYKHLKFIDNSEVIIKNEINNFSKETVELFEKHINKL